MTFKLPKVYPITDVRLSGLSHVEQVLRLSDGGATLIQLREKNLAPREFYYEAKLAMRAAREHGVLLIINDRVDIAMALGAAGVHLGQTDFPPEAARRLLGDHAIIGYSTHNIEQARSAATLPIDYLAIGPILETSSKRDADPVLGLDRLHRVRSATSSIPLVAIGGITLANAAEVINAGADSVAMIEGLLHNVDIGTRMREMLSLAQK